MVIDDFNILRALRRPYKTHAELIVNANAVLSGAVTPQGFQPVARRRTQKVERAGRVQLNQLPPRDGLDVDEPLHTVSIKQALRIDAFER